MQQCLKPLPYPKLPDHTNHGPTTPNRCTHLPSCLPPVSVRRLRHVPGYITAPTAPTTQTAYHILTSSSWCELVAAYLSLPNHLHRPDNPLSAIPIFLPSSDIQCEQVAAQPDNFNRPDQLNGCNLIRLSSLPVVASRSQRSPGGGAATTAASTRTAPTT